MARPFTRRYRIFLLGVGTPAAVISTFLVVEVAKRFGAPSLMTALLLVGLVASDSVVSRSGREWPARPAAPSRSRCC